MGEKQTYAVPGIFQPTANGQIKQIAGSCELAYLKLAAGGGACVISIYDCNTDLEMNNSTLKWVMDASTTDVDVNVFPNPLAFSKGIRIRVDQGGDFNCFLMYATVSPRP